MFRVFSGQQNTRRSSGAFTNKVSARSREESDKQSWKTCALFVYRAFDLLAWRIVHDLIGAVGGLARDEGSAPSRLYLPRVRFQNTKN